MLKKYFKDEEYECLKNTDNLLFKALELVVRVFEDKVDKGGMPYLNHLFKVYMNVSDYNEKISALLHDLVENTDIEMDELKEYGIPAEILENLSFLTKKKGEYYNDYIDRIISSKNIHVYHIKLADLKHNMDIKRINNPTVNDYERINSRYLPAYNKIQNELEKITKKGE